MALDAADPRCRRTRSGCGLRWRRRRGRGRDDGDGGQRWGQWRHARLRGCIRSRFPRPGARERRRVDPPDHADLRDARRARARRHGSRAGACEELGGRRGREVDHVHPPGGRQVPRRHRLQRGGRLLQLRPLVQLHGAGTERQRLVLLAGHVRRLREEQRGERRPRREPLRELRGHRCDDRGDQPDQAVGLRPRRSGAAGVRDREPEGARGVQG